MKQQTFNRNRCIIYRLVGFFSQLIALFTAISVNTVAYSIDKPWAFAVYRYDRQISDIFVYPYRLAALLHTEITQKIISASCTVIIQRILIRIPVAVIYKTVNRTVTAAQHNIAFGRNTVKKCAVSAYLRHIAIFQFIVLVYFRQLLCKLCSLPVAR